MDVQTLAQAAAQNLPVDFTGSGPGQSLAPQIPAVQAPPIPDPASGDGDGTVADAGAKPAPTLHLPQEIAKVFAGGSASHVSITFQVAHNPNEIVTVFKNTLTGEVITQVPSEIMIKMAEFFDQVAGVVLDKTA